MFGLLRGDAHQYAVIERRQGAESGQKGPSQGLTTSVGKSLSALRRAFGLASHLDSP